MAEIEPTTLFAVRRPLLTSVSLFSQLMSAKKTQTKTKDASSFPGASALPATSSGGCRRRRQRRENVDVSSKKEIGGIRALLLHIRQLIAPL